jgi:hypothetical protein
MQQSKEVKSTMPIEEDRLKVESVIPVKIADYEPSVLFQDHLGKTSAEEI